MTTDTAQVTWTAKGFTDEITACEICGKPELKGTVRMAAIDADGEQAGEVYAGVVCAARRAGRKAADIRTEAQRADRARAQAIRDTHRAWSDAESRWFCARRDAHFGTGRHIPFADLQAWRNSPEQQAAAAEWLAENPPPPTPW